jgi:hypothetical protein
MKTREQKIAEVTELYRILTLERVRRELARDAAAWGYDQAPLAALPETELDDMLEAFAGLRRRSPNLSEVAEADLVAVVRITAKRARSGAGAPS